MVNLFATDKLTKWLPAYKAFVEQELHPLDLALSALPFRETEKILQQKRQLAKDAKLWAPFLSVKQGGKGLTLTEFAQVSEWMGTSPFGHYVFNCQAPDIGNMELLHRHATKAQQKQFLEPLMAGEIRSCFSMTEPEVAGSNPVVLNTSAIQDREQWVLNGHKWFTTGADGAAFAIVMAVTDAQATPYQRASMLIVPTKTKGFNIIRNIPIMGEAGEGWLSHAEIEYQDCKVPSEHLLGARGAGFALAQERLGPGRIHHCMRWIGICERVFGLMCKHAVGRDMGDGQKLSEKQVIQHWIAESRADIDAARYYVLHTAQMIEQQGAKEARHHISAIKFFVANILHRLLDRAIQVHGALGVTDDTLLSFWYRHERGARIYDGPDEVHKTSLARQILNAYEQ
ncbi:MAG: acyl-CoA dehydrogenase family protein [Chitinophagaceae bacterium]